MCGILQAAAGILATLGVPYRERKYLADCLVHLFFGSPLYTMLGITVMGSFAGKLFHELSLILLALVILRNTSAAPYTSYFRNSGLLRRTPRAYMEPYWMNPCGDSSPKSLDTATQSSQNKVDIFDSGSFKHHFQAIRNYAEALYKQIQHLKTQKEDGDPYLKHQIHLFELAKFPQPPERNVEKMAMFEPETGLTLTYRLLQYIAVHLSSTEADENLYYGMDVEPLDDIQRGPNGLQVLMCSVRMAMNQASIEPDPAVTQELKTIDISSIQDSSRRNLRDILRLDGSAKILNFVFQLFGSFHQRSARK